MRTGLLVALCLWCVGLVAAACGGADPALPEIGRPADVVVDVVATDVPGPTQVVVEPDGSLIVAVINGEENGGTGQILRIDPSTGDRTVLFDGLDKPTGVQPDGDVIYVMEADRLSVGPVDGGDLTAVAEDLPNNGRSQGTITTHPDGGILFNTSGSARGQDVREGSGEIRRFTPPGDVAPVTVATGYKHAYALTFFGGDAQELWAIEVADGSFDGVRAVDEVVMVSPSLGGGWPRCVGNNRPVEEFEVAQAECDALNPSRAIFEAGATPTSIIVSPFHEDSFLVALWLTGEVVVVPRQGSDPTDWEVFASGFQNPQHLTVVDDTVYLSEYGANRVLKLSQSNER